MRRIEKELLNIAETDIGRACMIARTAGYAISVFDGDGENGMCTPDVNFNRVQEEE